MKISIKVVTLWLTQIPAFINCQPLPPFSIVHLGDSYSAGNGARDASGSRNFVEPYGCYRSPTNWGQIIANSLKDVFTVRYINRACSGAKLTHLMNSQSKTYGLSTIPPQIEAINKAVNLVLMTLGGNDVGFGSVAQECFVLGLRDVESCREAIDIANAALPSLKLQLIDALVTIGSLLNDKAKVVVVSYPHIILDSTFVLEEDDASIDLQATVRKLSEDADIATSNAVLEANSALGREFVIFFESMKNLFAGHEPDPSVLTSNPDRWLWEFDVVDANEWYHINPMGHDRLGEGLTAFIRLQNVESSGFNSTSAQPFAWLGMSYAGKVGEPITFDASGSYDTGGGILVLYEWDFNGDGTYDRSSVVPNVDFTYAKDFNGVVLLRVTSSSNLTALGNASITINSDGSVLMTNGTCALDSDGFSIIQEIGEFLDCLPDNLPKDLPGIRENTGTCSIGFFGIICFLLKILDFLTFWK